MAQLTDKDMWGMYLQALSQIQGIPNFSNIMLAGTSMPAVLNVATQAVLPAAPTAVALAQIYEMGNMLPKWSGFYTPSGVGDLFGQYEVFVRGIKLQGNPDPAIDAAINAARLALKDALTQRTTNKTSAFNAYKQEIAIDPTSYKSFTDFLQRTPWGSTLDQDSQAANAAQSQLDRDMARKYGSAYAPIQEAINAINATHQQMLDGSGSLVMGIQSDAGTSAVPMYNPSALGSPGFSQWLDQVVTQAGQGAAPQFSVTIKQDAASYDYASANFFAEGAASLVWEPFLWGAGEGSSSKSSVQVDTADSSFSLTITLQGVTYVSITPGTWYSPSIVGDFSNAELYPDSPLAGKPLWGPKGSFSVIPQGFIVGFRPSLTATFSAASYSSLKTQWSKQVTTAFGIGPFFLGEYSQEESGSTEHATWNDQHNSISWTDNTTLPRILGVIGSTPNYER